MVAKETDVSLPNWYFSKVNYVITHSCREMHILRCMPHCNFRVSLFGLYLGLDLGFLFITLGGEESGRHFMTFIIRISCQ